MGVLMAYSTESAVVPLLVEFGECTINVDTIFLLAADDDVGMSPFAIKWRF